MRKVIPVGAIVGLLATVAQSQAPSRVVLFHGDYDVSGNGKCADIDGTEYTITFPRHVKHPPHVDVHTSTADANDHLQAHVQSITDDYAVIVATGQGLHGHQLCATSTIHWTASI